MSMKVFSIVALAAYAQLASATFENNWAYKSPSINVRSLEIPINNLEAANRLTKRGEAEYFGGNVTFDFNVASGDPTADSVILWTKADKYDDPSSYYPVCVNWEVSKSNFTNEKDTVSNGEAFTTHEVDYTVKVEAGGLSPYTQYYYRFYNCAGREAGTSPVGTFKTMPAEDDKIDKIRMAVFSCANYAQGYYNGYGYAANHSEEIDFVQHLGDYTYEYKEESLIGRQISPNRETVSLWDYRDRYASYRRDPDLQVLHQKVAWQMVWDDHEVADGTSNFDSTNGNNTAQGFVNGVGYSERKANAVRAYFEWMPIRQVDTDDELRIWRSFQIGKLGDLIMIDTRHYDRDITNMYYNADQIRDIKDDPNRTIMGEKQEKWFLEQLSNSVKREATWKIIGSQILFSPIEYSFGADLSLDLWNGYTANRDRVLAHIEEEKINNIIFMAGDTHFASAYDVPPRDNTTYDGKSGSGAVAVEFGGTAVSSNGLFGTDQPEDLHKEEAKKLVDQHEHMKYMETNLRGFFVLELTEEQASATYYGVRDLTYRNDDIIQIAKFVVDKDTNRLKRPLNDGKSLEYGYLDPQTVNENNKRWGKDHF